MTDIHSAAQESALGTTPLVKAKLFISYSRKDMTFVDRFEAAVKSARLRADNRPAEIYAFEERWKRIHR